jgi:hypothetical protein
VLRIVGIGLNYLGIYMEPNTIESELFRIASYIDRWENPSRQKVYRQLSSLLLLLEDSDSSTRLAGWFSKTPLELETKARQKILKKAPAKYDELVKFIKSGQFTFAKLSEYDLYTVILFCSAMKKLSKAEFDSYLEKNGVTMGDDATADQRKAYKVLETVFKFLDNKPAPNSTDASTIFQHLGMIVGDARSKKLEDIFEDRTIVDEKKGLKLGILAKKIILLALKKANEEIRQEIRGVAGQPDPFSDEDQLPKSDSEKKESEDKEKEATKALNDSHDAIVALITRKNQYKALKPLLSRMANSLNENLDGAFFLFEYMNRDKNQNDKTLRVLLGLSIQKMGKNQLNLINGMFPQLDVEENYKACVDLLKSGEKIFDDKEIKNDVFGPGGVKGFFTNTKFAKTLDYLNKNFYEGTIKYPESLLKRSTDLKTPNYGLLYDYMCLARLRKIDDQALRFINSNFGELYQQIWKKVDDNGGINERDAAERLQERDQSRTPLVKPLGVADGESKAVGPSVVAPAGVTQPPAADNPNLSDDQGDEAKGGKGPDEEKSTPPDGRKYDPDQSAKFTPENTSYEILNSAESRRCLQGVKTFIDGLNHLTPDKRIEKLYELWDNVARGSQIKDEFKGESFDKIKERIDKNEEKLSTVITLDEMEKKLPERIKEKPKRYSGQDILEIGPIDLIRGGSILYSNNRETAYDSIANSNSSFQAYFKKDKKLVKVSLIVMEKQLYTFLKDYGEKPDLFAKVPPNVRIEALPYDDVKGKMVALPSEASAPAEVKPSNDGAAGAEGASPSALPTEASRNDDDSTGSAAEAAHPSVDGAPADVVRDLSGADPNESVIKETMEKKFGDLLESTDESIKETTKEIFLRLNNAVIAVLNEYDSEDVKNSMKNDIPQLQYILSQYEDDSLLNELGLKVTKDHSALDGITPAKVLESILYYQNYAKESNPVNKALEMIDSLGCYDDDELLGRKMKNPEAIRGYFARLYKDTAKEIEMLEPSYMRVLLNSKISSGFSAALVVPFGDPQKKGNTLGMSKYFVTDDGKQPHDKVLYYTKKIPLLVYNSESPGVDAKPYKIVKGKVSRQP